MWQSHSLDTASYDLPSIFSTLRQGRICRLVFTRIQALVEHISLLGSVFSGFNHRILDAVPRISTLQCASRAEKRYPSYLIIC